MSVERDIARRIRQIKTEIKTKQREFEESISDLKSDLTNLETAQEKLNNIKGMLGNPSQPTKKMPTKRHNGRSEAILNVLPFNRETAISVYTIAPKVMYEAEKTMEATELRKRISASMSFLYRKGLVARYEGNEPGVLRPQYFYYRVTKK